MDCFLNRDAVRVIAKGHDRGEDKLLELAEGIATRHFYNKVLHMREERNRHLRRGKLLAWDRSGGDGHGTSERPQCRGGNQGEQDKAHARERPRVEGREFVEIDAQQPAEEHQQQSTKEQAS